MVRVFETTTRSSYTPHMAETAGAPPFLPPRLAAMLRHNLIDGNADTGRTRLERCAPTE